MIHELGAFLIVAVATSSGLPQGAGCICPFNYAPVCGSDGQTYGNACGLRCAQASQPDLVMKSTGQCSHQPQCICTLDLSPVCGTDGKTYDNECSMNCLAVSKLHDGECEKVHVAPRSIPTCTCTRNYKPVCGTDGQTYNNDCLLNCATGSNPQLGIRHPGACELVKVVNFPSKCTCTTNYKPVCGTDGQTYDNDCLLNCATIDNSKLGIKHAGSCEQVMVAPISPPTCSCRVSYEPVCGTDGQTYANDCLLNCATINNSRLGIRHAGQCDQVTPVNNSDDRCACQRQYKPVCASNGETYNNDCLLNCAQKDTPDLRMVHEGGCEVLRG